MSGKSILIVGATRGTGLQLARILQERGEQVFAMARPGSDREALAATGAEIIEGDAFNREDFDHALEGRDVSTLVLSLAGKRGEPRVDVPGTKNAIEAARAYGITRLISLGAIGAGNSFGAMSEKAQEILGPVMEVKTEAEKLIMESGLDWTLFRGGALTDDPETGTGMLTEDPTLIGTITRPEWARLVADCLAEDGHIGKVYSAIDREMIGVTFF